MIYFQGSSTSSPVLGKVCGTTLPNFINSTNTSMTLKFSSDEFSINLGYKAIISPVGTGKFCISNIRTCSIYKVTYPEQCRYRDIRLSTNIS